MSKTYYKYKVRCTTDNKDEHWILESTDSVPTTCPTNSAHTIDTSLTSVVRTISDNLVIIKEEDTATGGNFQTCTAKVNAVKNAKSFTTFSWPYPVSALNVDFITTEEHNGDFIEVTVGEDTIIGALGGNVSPASAWTSQNYTVGQIVTFTHPFSGERVYTCIANTVSNENPTNTTYWRHGFELIVSSTVIQYTKVGAYIKLDDFVNSDDVARVLYKDTVNSKIYVEKNLTNSFSALSPTYVRNTIYIIKDYELGNGWEHCIGDSKIGGSYVPADTVIRIYYDNKSTDTDKVFIGRVEFLY